MVRRRAIGAAVAVAVLGWSGCSSVGGDDAGGQPAVFRATGSLSVPRAHASAALLSDGTVLVAGGYSGGQLKSAERYDPSGEGSFTATGSMAQARMGATATALPSGKVLIAGGFAPVPPADAYPVNLASAELYDPDAAGGQGAFTPIGSMADARAYFTATLLPGGKVLLAGGAGTSAELYLPAADGGRGAFLPTGSLATDREAATATLLRDGTVLIAGGGVIGGAWQASAERFDPAANGGRGAFRATGSMAVARGGAVAALLPDGRVLIAGGSAANPDGGYEGIQLASAELYDPAGNGGQGAFRPTGSMAQARSGATATLLRDGTVLVVGGWHADLIRLSSAERFDPAAAGGAGAFTPAASLATGRSAATATMLVKGSVLVVGGYGGSGLVPTSTAERYGP